MGSHADTVTPNAEPATAAVPAPAAVVLLRATREEAVGAELQVAGLRVIDRAVRQLGRAPGARVILAADGTIPLPSALPPNVEVRQLDVGNESELAALARAAGAGVVLGADVVRVKAADFAGGLRVVDEPSRKRAEDAVFADLLRGDLGFIARHINKKISFRITRHLLCRLPVTPNQVTLGAAAVGLLGCLFIAGGGHVAVVVGLLLAQLQSILDGCDGELARVRFQQSHIGEWLDTIVDDLLNLALIGSLGLGLSRQGHGWPAAVAAIAALAMCLFYNVVSYRELLRQGLGGELIKIRWKLVSGRDMKSMIGANARGGTLQRLLLALGRRDTFVFGWLVLALVNLLPVALLWAVLVALAYFIMALGQLLTPDTPI